MENNKKSKIVEPLYSRPVLWIFLFCFSLSFLLVLQWDHPLSMVVAAPLAASSIACLLGVSWSLGRIQKNVPKPLSSLGLGVENYADGILVSDAEGNVQFVNASFKKLIGIEQGLKDFNHTNLKQFFSRTLRGQDQVDVLGVLDDARIGKRGKAYFEIQDKNKNVTSFCLDCSPFADKGNVTGGVFLRLEDVSLSKEAEHLRNSKEKYVADMLDLLPVGFFSADNNGILLYVNKTLARWLGKPPEHLIGTPFADYVAEIGGEADLTLQDNEGRRFSAALEQSHKDNSDGEVDYTRSIVLRDLVWHEIDRKLASSGEILSPGEENFSNTSIEKLKNTEQLFFDNSPIGIVLVDTNGNVTRCNRTFLHLIGLHREIVIGHPFVNQLAKEDRNDISTNFSKILMGISKGAQLEVRMHSSKDREITVALYANLIVDQSKEISGIVLHLIDLTEQRNLEVQFSQSQKMQAIGQLAGGVAHDFNNLLTAMIGFSDLLLTRHGPDDPSFNDIQQIRQNAHRATNLVRQLLAFSRKQKLQLIRLDVVEALSELSSLLRRLIGEKVELLIEPSRGIYPIYADRGQFDQVIINLVVNARDAMPGGGSITIKSSNTEFETSTQRGHDLIPPGQYVLIEVIDTGEGIPKENLEHIFEPFFSTKDVGSGTGLGLSTVYGIVHQSGGFVFVDSAPGEGTKFSIFLPEHANERIEGSNGDKRGVIDSNISSDVSDEDLTGSAVVLLVEDEDAVRIFAKRALENKGYNVLTADNGEGALDVINGTDLKIDLIVSDVIMPGMDGNTLVGIVRQEIPDVKVILMSGYAEDIFHDEIVRDETLHFLGKPFTLKDLASKVKDVLSI